VQNNQATDFTASLNSSAENSCNNTSMVILYSEENPEEKCGASRCAVRGKATGE
jgi:hypothetical protein